MKSFGSRPTSCKELFELGEQVTGSTMEKNIVWYTFEVFLVFASRKNDGLLLLFKVGMKGNPRMLNRGLDCDVIVAEVRATSHKPDEMYGIIERLSPGTRKIELFGRPHNVQPNWLVDLHLFTYCFVLQLLFCQSDTWRSFRVLWSIFQGLNI